MTPIYYAWLLSFIVLTALSFKLQDERRKVVINVFLVFATVFVVISAYTGLMGRANANLAYTQSDRAEILLKLTSANVAIESYTASLPGSKDMTEAGKEKLYDEADELLTKAVEAAPKSATLLAKKIILLGEQGKNVKKLITQLKASPSEKSENLVKTLEKLYVNRKVSKAEYPEIKKIVDKDIPNGWYREIANLQLAKSAGHTKEFNKLHADFHEHYLLYVLRLGGFGCVAIFSFLIGLIVVVVQLFFLPRKLTEDDKLSLILAPPDWSWKAVYGVFVGWLTIEFLIAPPLKTMAASLATVATESGITTVALLTAGLYLFQNLPSLILIWLIALRPHKLPLLDSLKLRLKVENRGLFKLVLAGVLTWYAAIPIIAGAVFISNKLGSQGSDNPIVAIVMAAAKEADIIGIVLFIIALGVLPALIEEILFRGFLYTSLRRKFSIFPSLVVSAAVFSAIHLDLGGALQLFCLGFLFALVLEKTRSLIPSMVAHCMWNSCTFIMALVAYS